MSTMLYLLVSVIAFAITAALGKWMIPFLHKLKFGQTIREVGPSWHKNKQGTPTMGGLMFILGIAIAMIVCLPIAYSLGLEETVLLRPRPSRVWAWRWPLGPSALWMTTSAS